MLSGMLGRKVGMTQIFGPDGAAIPVTLIEAGPCTVTQVKTAGGPDRYEAVQLGFGQATIKHTTRPLLGHLGHSLEPTPRQHRHQQQAGQRARQLTRRQQQAQQQPPSEGASAGTSEGASEGASAGEATTTAADIAEASATPVASATATDATATDATGTATAAPARRQAASRRRGGGKALGPFRVLREVGVLDDELPAVGDVITAALFTGGEDVDIIGTSKGKGFAGVMKRHHFGGGPRTHGQSDRERRPGSIGSGTTPGRVLKGTRMAGRMGGERVTVRGLRVIESDAERNLLLVQGSIPGPNGGIVMIRKGAAAWQALHTSARA